MTLTAMALALIIASLSLPALLLTLYFRERTLLPHVSDTALIAECEKRTIPTGIPDHISDTVLLRECENRDLPRYEDPIDRLEKLPDERGTAYVWRVETDERKEKWLETLTEYQKNFGEFEALHIVVTDSEELWRLDRNELEGYL